MAQRAGSGQLFASAFALGDFFHPETFLNVLRQQTARQRTCTIRFFIMVADFSPTVRCAMDTLKLVASWRGSIDGGQLSVTVTGMLLQGADLGSGVLTDPPANAPELVRIPDFKIAWVPSTTPDPYRSTEVCCKS